MSKCNDCIHKNVCKDYTPSLGVAWCPNYMVNRYDYIAELKEALEQLQAIIESEKREEPRCASCEFYRKGRHGQVVGTDYGNDEHWCDLAIHGLRVHPDSVCSFWKEKKE